MKKKTLIILAVVLVIILGVIIGAKLFMNSIEANMKELTVLTIPNVDITNAEDGTYEGSYEVFPVAAKVKVTLENHKIKAIELIEHKNGQGKAAEVLPDKVVEAQTLDVDIVSGATYSSKVILKAIENALNSADK